MQTRVCLMLLLCLIPLSASGRTITVAKDGSGEFAVIQHAVDVAQPGDTIEVGPGQYIDVHLVQFPLEVAYVAVLLATPNVTIRGVGATTPIIGFVRTTPEFNGHRTAGIVVQSNADGGMLENIRVEHMAVLVSLLAPMTFIDCSFRSPAEFGVGLGAIDGSRFVRCSFSGPDDGSYITGHVIGFVGQNNPNAVFEDCSMVGKVGFGIRISGAPGFRVERCIFSGLIVGLHVGGAVGGIIRDCVFEEIERVDVSVDEGSDVVLENTVLGSTSLTTLSIGAPCRLVGRQNRLYGSARRTVETLGGVDLTLTEGDILNGGGLSVEVLSPAAYTARIDLRNNYWGATDLNQIATWIRDGNDPPPPGCWYCPAAAVDYLPVLQGTVPNVESTFGGLKARFGAGKE